MRNFSNKTMQNHKYNRASIIIESLSCFNFATDLKIIGFCNLFDLLRWYLDSKRSLGSVSEEFLPKDTEEIYYQAKPIIIFRRDKINIKKLEKIFAEFQEIRDHEKEILKNITDNPLSKLPDLENPLAYLDDYIEKFKTERFIHANPYLKYFAICNMTQIVVKKHEIVPIENKTNEIELTVHKAHELDDIINYGKDGGTSSK